MQALVNIESLKLPEHLSLSAQQFSDNSADLILLFPDSWKLRNLKLSTSHSELLSAASDSWSRRIQQLDQYDPLKKLSLAIDLILNVKRNTAVKNGKAEAHLHSGTINRIACILEESLNHLSSEKRASLFSFSQIIPGLICVEMPNEAILGATFVRFQEFYESPLERFRSQSFTLEQYKKAYSNEPYSYMSEFSYYLDWAGFNIPGKIFSPEIVKKLNPLSKIEQTLVDQLNNFTEISESTYVIASVPTTCPEDKDTREHEIRHGFYYLRSDYRNVINSEFAKLDLSELKSWLLQIGYCSEVLTDECQACLGSDLDYLRKITSLQLTAADFLKAHEIVKDQESLVYAS